MEAKDIVKKFLVSGEIASQPRDVVALKIAKASFAAGKQEGMKEVVDWVKENIAHENSDGGIFISGYIAGEKW